MKHLMFDIEALGNECIVQIGACYFNPETGEIGEKFKVNININSFKTPFNNRMVEFWLHQPRETIDSILAPPKTTEEEALKMFFEFANKAEHMWSHTSFDFVMLERVSRRLNVKKPNRMFKKSMDIRTLIKLANFSSKTVVREGTHHDALDDAVHQAKYCSLAWQKLKGRKNEHK